MFLGVRGLVAILVSHEEAKKEYFPSCIGIDSLNNIEVSVAWDLPRRVPGGSRPLRGQFQPPQRTTTTTNQQPKQKKPRSGKT